MIPHKLASRGCLLPRASSARASCPAEPPASGCRGRMLLRGRWHWLPLVPAAPSPSVLAFSLHNAHTVAWSSASSSQWPFGLGHEDSEGKRLSTPRYQAVALSHTRHTIRWSPCATLGILSVCCLCVACVLPVCCLCAACVLPVCCLCVACVPAVCPPLARTVRFESSTTYTRHSRHTGQSPGGRAHCPF
jgi:hypothetical protein